ncbi:MAG: glycerol kinase, partial [Bdellovibrionales bacterium]|nr:glycerol kinase [Bdellovibrionales bacterium]
TSSRAVVYGLDGSIHGHGTSPLAVTYPREGWVEQSAEEIWQSQKDALLDAVAGIAGERLLAVGITNQRETVVCWDRHTGRALGPAIVWQCRRTASRCEELRAKGQSDFIRQRTGLVIDPYFSATKMRWLVEQVPEVRAGIEGGSAVFGTVDSWILYRLSREAGSAVLRTEPSNASRTLLADAESADWDEELLALFQIPRQVLCDVGPSFGERGTARVSGRGLPVTGVLGDQQASLLGHGCIEPSYGKCTFGTGAFLLMHTGSSLIRSTSGLLSTVAWQEPNQKPTFALEGSVFVAGALIDWLRSELRLFDDYDDLEALASAVAESGGAVVVPAFTGLGAPHWDDRARGLIGGLTRGTTRAQLCYAALAGIAFQIGDLLAAPECVGLHSLSIDGGLSRNRAFCQILADVTGRPIDRAGNAERTSLGAAIAAAVGAGCFATLHQAVAAMTGASQGIAERFSPRWDAAER